MRHRFHVSIARRPRAVTVVTVACAAAMVALASAAPASAQEGEPPLSPFVAQRVAVVPVQFLRSDTAAPLLPAQWATARRELDDSIGTALAERGLGNKWAYAADIDRLAKRNRGYVSDPYTLGAGSFRARPLRPNDAAPSLLLSNLRSLIALGDARYALIPVELAFVREDDKALAVLRLVLLDGRGGRIVWFADIAVPAGTAFGSAQIGELARSVADLVVR